MSSLRKRGSLASGALAGSILKMNDGLYNLIEYTHDSLENLWRNEFESSHRIKIDDHKGSLAIGKDADIVVVDDTIRVDKTIKSGLYINIKELDDV